MYTSYEQRLEFLHQFIDGSLAFHKNLPDAKLTKGDGWQLYSAEMTVIDLEIPPNMCKS